MKLMENGNFYKNLKQLKMKRKMMNLILKATEDTLKEIRIALLESDVNYQVVKDFLERVRQESIGQDVINAVEPGQLLVKIVAVCHHQL